VKANLKLATSLFALAMITACGSESDDGLQYEDSESNDQDSIVQRVGYGKVIGSLAHGVDMYDYYLVYSEGIHNTTVSVTNKAGMNLVLSEVSILKQLQQRSNSNNKNEAGHEVETFESSGGNYYSTYIEVSVLEGWGEYTLSINKTPVETESN
jgi:hypothetical protein